MKISEETARRYVEKTSPLKNAAWLTSADYPPAAWQKDDFNMWFSAQAEYAEYFCTERSNAFVIALLWYAMITGSDVRFEAPLSRKLYDGLTQKLIPALMPPDEPMIRLDGPLSSEPID